VRKSGGKREGGRERERERERENKKKERIQRARESRR